MKCKTCGSIIPNNSVECEFCGTIYESSTNGADSIEYGGKQEFKEKIDGYLQSTEQKIDNCKIESMHEKTEFIPDMLVAKEESQEVKKESVKVQIILGGVLGLICGIIAGFL